MGMPSVSNNQESSMPKEKLSERFSSIINRLKLIGVLTGTMFMTGENLSAHEGDYKMKEVEKARIEKLTNEVDSLVGVLQKELSVHKPSARWNDTGRNDETGNMPVILDETSLKGKNIEIGEKDSSSYASWDGNFITSYDKGWIIIADKLNATTDSLTKDCYSYYGYGEEKPGEEHRRTIEHYTNKNASTDGGKIINFQFGHFTSFSGDVAEDLILVSELEGHRERKGDGLVQNFSDSKVEIADGREGTELEKTLVAFKAKVEIAIKQNKNHHLTTKK